MHHGWSNFRVIRCMNTLFSLDVVVLLFSSFVLCRYYFSSGLFNLSVLIFSLFPSAAINQRPHDCMHSAGEDGGLERVFINRHTNTNCVAEKRSTAANHVSNYMAQFYCLLHVIYYPR